MNKSISILKHTIFIILALTLTLNLSACGQETTDQGQATQPVDASTSQPIPSNTALPDVPAVTETATSLSEEAPPATEIPPATPTILPTPPQEPIGGVELHNITDQGGLVLLQGTNARWIRRNSILWPEVEPNPGDRNWDTLASLENELKTASEQGYQVILIIRNTPDWARMIPEYPCSPIKSESFQAFANFMHDVVARYSAPPYNVKFWELGNEPDVDHQYIPPTMPFGCWGDETDPYNGGGYYGEMLKAVYPQIKAADTEAQVLIGGLLLDCSPINPPETSPGSGEFQDCTSAKFLEGILQNGGGDFFDGVSFHAYDYYFGALGQYGNPGWHSNWNTTGPALIAKIEYLRSLLGIYGYPQKYLINTETALICGRDGTEPACQSDEFNQTKANYAAQSYAAALANGLRANIWYSITGWRASGLVNRDMQPTWVFTAYSFSLRMLDQAAYRDQITDLPGILGYRFEKNGQPLWVIWAIEEQPQTIDLPANPLAIYNVYGEAITAAQTIEVTLDPIYIEFTP